MKRGHLGVLLLVLYLLHISLGAKVINLNKDNYKSRVVATAKTDTWLIEFYAPWCGYCKSFAPIFDNMANLLKIEQVKVAKTDCEPNKELCDMFHVTRFPTIKLIRDGYLYDYKFRAGTDETMLGHFVREGYDEKEPEDVPGFKYYHTPIVNIGLDNFTKVIGKRDWMVEFYSSQCALSDKFAPIYQKLGDRFAANMSIGKVNCLENPDLCQVFNIDIYPTLYHVQDDQMWKFNEGRSFKNLTKFFRGGYLNAPPQTLPTSYGKWQPLVKEFQFYFLGVEYFLMQHFWKTLAATFIYGIVLGSTIFSKSSTPRVPQTRVVKKVVKVTKQQEKPKEQPQEEEKVEEVKKEVKKEPLLQPSTEKAKPNEGLKSKKKKAPK